MALTPDVIAEALELAPLDKLIHEALRRCDCGIIMLMQVEKDADRQTLLYRQWRGNPHACAGLAMDAAQSVLDEFYSREDVQDNDEDDS